MNRRKKLPVPSRGYRLEFTYPETGETFELVIDLVSLAVEMARRASENRSKRASDLGRLVRCQVLKS